MLMVTRGLLRMASAQWVKGSVHMELFHCWTGPRGT
jgi:hypothetical protein